MMKSRVVVALAVALVGVLSTASLALAQTSAPETTTSSKTLYLNREGCNGTTVGRLLPTYGHEGDCGGYWGLPYGELWPRIGWDTSEEFHSTTTTEPFKLNAAKNVTGQLRANSWYAPEGWRGGVGTVTFDVRLEMQTDNGSTIRFVPISVSQDASPTGPTFVRFSMPVPSRAIGAVVTRTSMVVLLRGANYPMNVLALKGDSYLVIPAKK